MFAFFIKVFFDIILEEKKNDVGNTYFDMRTDFNQNIIN